MREQRSAEDILRELVAISTPSVESNMPLLRWVELYLEPLDWQIEIYGYLDDQGIEKGNLVARPRSYAGRPRVDLAFVGHTDTVPYRREWTDALRLTQRGEDLHGCGACDVKGSLACFLSAIQDLTAGNVALILTADEEVGCKGMERLLEHVKLSIGSAIVSEPTSLRAGVAGKGYGLARVIVRGREAHSAFPEQGVSAISCAARLITSIEDKFSQRPHVTGAAIFDPPRTTINIGVIDGGSAKNIVPGHCSFLVEWRPLPAEDRTAVLDELKKLAAQFEAVDGRVSIEVEAMRAEGGFAPAENGQLRMQLMQILKSEPIGISFGSEATRVARIADEVIVIGPGDMRTAHSDRECVPIAELELWTNALRRLITQFE